MEGAQRRGGEVSVGWGTLGRLLGGGTSPGPGRMVKLRSEEMGRELQAQGMA